MRYMPRKVDLSFWTFFFFQSSTYLLDRMKRRLCYVDGLDNKGSQSYLLVTYYWLYSVVIYLFQKFYFILCKTPSSNVTCSNFNNITKGKICSNFIN